VFRFRVALALVLAITPLRAEGQLDVIVRDSGGRAVVDARVELWNASALVAARSTDAEGIARYSTAEVAAATAGLVRRIGFSPAQFSLPASGASLTVQLEALAYSVPAMTVRAVAESCPQPDDPAARATWEAAAARYQEPTTSGRVTRLEQHTSRVAEADVGIIDGERLFDGWRFYTTPGMEGAVRRIERRGYVYALLRENHTEEMLGAWQYPPLEAELAGHFATAIFGARHTFRLVAATASVVTLRYCARDRRATGLDGTLRLSVADGLLDARWRYWNPSPGRESAGGEATFAPAARDGVIAPMVSTSGLFWRRTPSGRYAQRWQRYIEWKPMEEDGVVENSAVNCRPPVNYVVCSAIRVRRNGGAVLDCSMMPFRCADDLFD
jgi:hypothetical protein